MFIASVLAFCTGIYLQAVFPLPFRPLFFTTLAIALLLPVLTLRRYRVFCLLMLVCFIASGATRLALLDPARTILEGETQDTIYEGIVAESSPRIAVLTLTGPRDMKGMRVAFASGLPLQTGDRISLLGRVREMRPSFRNLGASSWKWLKRLEGVGYEIKGRVIARTPGPTPLSRMRRYFKENIEASGARHRDTLKALTIGDRAAIPQEKNDLFLHTGTSHVLAISGFNVGIISGFFFFLLKTLFGRIRALGMSGSATRYAALLTIPFPFVFMFVAGAGVSVIRATIMIIVFMLGVVLERQRDFYNTMALAALAILLLYPHSLFTPSFQLTFMSLLFIVLFMERLLPLLHKIRNRLCFWSASTVLSTMAATLGTAPIVVYYFHGTNPFCVLHNLVTIPLTGVAATALSLVGMLLPGGAFLLTLAGHIVDFNIAFLGALDFGYLYPLIRPTFTEILLYYAVITAFLFIRVKPVAGLLIFFLLPAALVQAYATYTMRFNTDLKVHVIDVGMGDATLIEAPGGLRVLIDGGGLSRSDFDIGKQVIAPFLLYRKIRTIDYVINTHPHADHIGGLGYVMRHFTVRHLITSGHFPHETGFLDLLQTARSRNTPHSVWQTGDGLEAGRFAIDVLHPGRGTHWDNPNDASLVLRVRYGNVKYLLPADIHGDIERALVAGNTDLRADILKVTHHGSAASNSRAFIYAVRPSLAVMSTGGGIKNLPGPGALQPYRDLSIPLLRTDRQGLIEVRSDGKRFSASAYVR